jgi:hypothetical protein
MEAAARETRSRRTRRDVDGLELEEASRCRVGSDHYKRDSSVVRRKPEAAPAQIDSEKARGHFAQNDTQLEYSAEKHIKIRRQGCRAKDRDSTFKPFRRLAVRNGRALGGTPGVATAVIIFEGAREIFAGVRVRVARDLLGSSRGHDGAALRAAFRTQIDNPIG